MSIEDSGQNQGENRVYKLDIDSPAYRKHYERGVSEPLVDELDLIIKDLLSTFVKPLSALTPEEIIAHTRKYIDEKDFDVLFLEKLESQLFFHGVCLALEVYTDEDVAASAPEGDDFEETHADLSVSQGEAISLKGKFGVDPSVDLKDVFLNIQIGIEIKLEELKRVEGFNIEYKELPIYVDRALRDEYLLAIQGKMTATEISNMNIVDLEKFGDGIAYINSKLRDMNILPEFALGMVNIETEEEKKDILERLSSIRSIIKEHVELYYDEKLRAEFTPDDLDEKIRELLQDLDTARIDLLDLDTDSLSEIYKRVSNYHLIIFKLAIIDTSSDDFSKAVAFFLNKEGEITRTDVDLLVTNLKRLERVVGSMLK